MDPWYRSRDSESTISQQRLSLATEIEREKSGLGIDDVWEREQKSSSRISTPIILRVCTLRPGAWMCAAWESATNILEAAS